MWHISPLEEWADNDTATNYQLVFLSVFVTVTAGIMSGLTLGLMSLDSTQMEVLIRSGNDREKRHARKIMKIIKNPHHLLVTLLLCNAGAMTTLPLFLDRLADPVTALLLSVTAVLLFGEIIPQAICARYGLLIGAKLSQLVWFLMWLTSPLSWTLGRLLDLVLGREHHSLFRRQQLKALVDVHGEATGLGGGLSLDEIKVITGALDLTNKIAYRSMTPLRKVQMLSTEDRLDEATLRMVLDWGHSRIPVHRAGNRSDLIGILLVKELLQYKMSKDVPVAKLKMRSLPRLSAATPMYDMLKLFQTGRIHMAVLTQPEVVDEEDEPVTPALRPTDMEQQVVEAMAVAAISAAEAEESLLAASHGEPAPQRKYTGLAAAAVASHTPADPDLATDGASPSGTSHGALPSGSATPFVSAGSHTVSADTSTTTHPIRSPRRRHASGTPSRHGTATPADHDGGSGAHDDDAGVSRDASGHPVGSAGAGSALAASDVGSSVCVNLGEFKVEYDDDYEEEGVGEEEAGRLAEGGGGDGVAPSAPRHSDRDLAGPVRSKKTRVPKLAPVGEPIGIITIEDVIEELIRTEIVDETDRYVDNHHSVRVEQAVLAAALPERLRQAVAGGNLPVDVMLKTNRGRRAVSMSHGLAAAINSLTQPLLSAAESGTR